MNGTNGTNGTPPDPAGLLAGSDGFARWRRFTEVAAEAGEKRLAQAKGAIWEAQEAVARLEREVAILHRALRLQPEPAPGPREKGARAATHIMECLRLRFQESRDPGFTTRTIRLACKAWPRTTWEAGLRRLITDGLIVRTGYGEYSLTEQGQRHPPAAPKALTLPTPRERAEARR